VTGAETGTGYPGEGDAVHHSDLPTYDDEVVQLPDPRVEDDPRQTDDDQPDHEGHPPPEEATGG